MNEARFWQARSRVVPDPCDFQTLRSCSWSYCEAVIGAPALPGILIYQHKLRFLRCSEFDNWARWQPLATDREQLL